MHLSRKEKNRAREQRLGQGALTLSVELILYHAVWTDSIHQQPLFRRVCGPVRVFLRVFLSERCVSHYFVCAYVCISVNVSVSV